MLYGTLGQGTDVGRRPGRTKEGQLNRVAPGDGSVIALVVVRVCFSFPHAFCTAVHERALTAWAWN